MAERKLHKDLRRIQGELESQGFTTRVTKDGHLMVFSSRGQAVTTFSGTPSDPKAWRNALAQCARAGFVEHSRSSGSKRKRAR